MLYAGLPIRRSRAKDRELRSPLPRPGSYSYGASLSSRDGSRVRRGARAARGDGEIEGMVGRLFSGMNFSASALSLEKLSAFLAFRRRLGDFNWTVSLSL